MHECREECTSLCTSARAAHCAWRHTHTQIHPACIRVYREYHSLRCAHIMYMRYICNRCAHIGYSGYTHRTEVGLVCNWCISMVCECIVVVYLEERSVAVIDTHVNVDTSAKCQCLQLFKILRNPSESMATPCTRIDHAKLIGIKCSQTICVIRRCWWAERTVIIWCLDNGIWWMPANVINSRRISVLLVDLINMYRMCNVRFACVATNSLFCLYRMTEWGHVSSRLSFHPSRCTTGWSCAHVLSDNWHYISQIIYLLTRLTPEIVGLVIFNVQYPSTLRLEWNTLG